MAPPAESRPSDVAPSALRPPRFGAIRPRHPAQLIVTAFGLAIAVGSLLLALPAASAGPGGAPFLTALFTATSAISVTGLVVVDTPTYWSGFGEAVIIGLVQVGGFGVMTLTSILALLVARRLGLRSRLVARAEQGVHDLGDLRSVIVGVAAVSLAVESVVAVVLIGRLWLGYGEGFGTALYQGGYHAVSAFNNAGFVLFERGMYEFVTDPWISVTIALAVIAGGLGFPVWLELRRELRTPRLWSLHTKLTLTMTAVLIVAGTAALLALEWSNARTFGPLDPGGKLIAGFFAGVMPRNGGFNTVDIAAMEPETLLVTDMLMFVGAGSASTGGGIKVTTFAILAVAVLAELRGAPVVHVFGRRVPASAQRQALAVTFVSLNAVVLATVVLMATSGFGLTQTLFEVLSAFTTTGLSTGITADLDTVGRLLLIFLMFAGRVGPYTLGLALILRRHDVLYRYPEERPIIG